MALSHDLAFPYRFGNPNGMSENICRTLFGMVSYPNSFSTSLRYGDALLSGLRTGVDDPLFISCSDNFDYVYNDNVNAVSSRSKFRAKLDDNLMTEELCNRDNFYKAFSLPLLNVSHIASAAGLNTVLSTGKAFTSPVISPFCKRSMISSITASECII